MSRREDKTSGTTLTRAAALFVVVMAAGIAAAGAQAAPVNGLTGARNQVSISYGLGSGGCFQDTVDANGQHVCQAYASTALQAAGVTPGSDVRVGGIEFAWPNTTSGKPDSMTPNGQTINVAPPLGTNTLALLGACHNGPIEQEVDLTYSTADAGGNYTDVEFVTVPDWWAAVNSGGGSLAPSPNPAPAELRTPFQVVADAVPALPPVSVWAMIVPVDSTRQLASISFPVSKPGVAFFDMQLVAQ